MVTGEVYHRIWFDWEGIKKTQNCCTNFLKYLDEGIIGIQDKKLCLIKERAVGCDYWDEGFEFFRCPGCGSQMELIEDVPPPPPPPVDPGAKLMMQGDFDYRR